MRSDQDSIRHLFAIVVGLGMLVAPAFHVNGASQDSAPAAGQPGKSGVTVQVKVVNVPATVRDKHGKIVSNLTKDDFILQEDGRFQDIHYFSRENDLPLTLGLLVDTSVSQRRVLGQERDASSSFIDQMLRPDKDQAFLIHFDREVVLDQDLTSSREKLHSALQSLQTPQFAKTGGTNPQDRDQDSQRRGDGGTHRGGTLLYDAVYLASDEITKKQTGHKAIVVLSDGVDRGSKETLHGAIEAAQRADTSVYAIYFKSEPSYGGYRGGYGPWGGPMGGHRRGGPRRYPQEERTDGKKILEQISHETGGRLFEVSGKESVDKIYAQIQEELRSQYSLGYTPDRVGSAAGYHKIELKAKNKDLTVQARAGYYAE
jgi:VWFA-related protein